MKKFLSRTAISGVLASAAMLVAPASLNADQVFVTDVIVQGSLCVGMDCVNNENFGFDTIVLKENNLRIFFNDTSNSASFPSNDWRLTANGSNNGDDSYFSIDDATAGRQVFRVDAGAPANSLRVDSAGDVGIGASNPVVELHVRDGDSPTLRLEQDGSSGFTAQTFDLVSNEANFFIRDVTNGSQLPFRIKPGADTDSLFIAANNSIGIGTDNPQVPLHLRVNRTGLTNEVFRIENTQNNGAVSMVFQPGGTGDSWKVKANGGTNGDFIISHSGLAGQQLLLDTDGNLVISGELTTAGSCSIGCDAVFDADYDLPSIESHAEFMFENGHLFGVGPTDEDGPFNITEKVGGMLGELEIAHIYIAQLHERLAQSEADIAELRAEVRSQ